MMTSRRVVVGLLTAVVVAWSCGVGPATAQLLINGAGATFPYPIYSKWFDEYAKISRSVNFNYQSIGSGGGIRQNTASTVECGATDGSLTDEQLKTAAGRLFTVPTVVFAVVVTY